MDRLKCGTSAVRNGMFSQVLADIVSIVYSTAAILENIAISNQLSSRDRGATLTYSEDRPSLQCFASGMLQLFPFNFIGGPRDAGPVLLKKVECKKATALCSLALLISGAQDCVGGSLANSPEPDDAAEIGRHACTRQFPAQRAEL